MTDQNLNTPPAGSRPDTAPSCQTWRQLSLGVAIMLERQQYGDRSTPQVGNNRQNQRHRSTIKTPQNHRARVKSP
jgi:hypothetical protein